MLDDAGLEALQRAEAIMLGQHVVDDLFFQQDSATGRYYDLEFGRGWIGPRCPTASIEKLEKDELYRAWLGNALFERVANVLVDGEVAIYRACLMTKAASGGTELLWHQDGGRFWGVDRAPTLQIWYRARRHAARIGLRRGLAREPSGGPGHARRRQRGPGADGLVDADSRAVALPARAGEALLLHNHVWHRSGRNTTGRPRRAFTVCYMSAATKRLCTEACAAPVFPAVFLALRQPAFQLPQLRALTQPVHGRHDGQPEQRACRQCRAEPHQREQRD